MEDKQCGECYQMVEKHTVRGVKQGPQHGDRRLAKGLTVDMVLKSIP